MNNLADRTLVVFTQLEPDAVVFLCALDRHLRINGNKPPKKLILVRFFQRKK